MEKLTKQTLETLRYRKEQLERKAGQAERLLSGRETGLPALTRDEDGRYSEEKTRALVEKLMDSLDLHLRCYESFSAPKDCLLSQLPSALGEEERRFYRSFLYCLLRLAQTPPPWDVVFKGTFGDLLEMGLDILEYREREQLYLDLAYRGVCASETWLWMDILRRDFTGAALEDALTPEEAEAVKKRYPREVAEALELKQAQKELDSDPALLEAYSEPLEEWEQEELRQQEEQLRDWLENFPEKETFCREYMSWQRDYFALQAWCWLDRHMEAMLDVYLYREGSSSFFTDEVYFSAYALLNRAVKQLRALLDERE